MSEPEKDFESFREGHRPTSSPSREDMTRLQVLQGGRGPTSSPSGEDAPDFELLKANLDAYVVHWNTRYRQVKLEGLTPEEFRSQSLVA